MRVTKPVMVEGSPAQVEISLIVVEDLPYAVFLPAVMRWAGWPFTQGCTGIWRMNSSNIWLN